MNYNELFSQIQAYTENQFPAMILANGSSVSYTTQINTFIQQAEERIYNTVQIPSLRKNVTGNCTVSNKYLACPNDYLSTYSLAIINTDGTYEYLLNKDVNFIRQAYPDPTSTGLPRYYALFGSRLNDPNELTFILGPTPNASYGAELHYFYYPASIVTAGTSWLGDNYSPALLYGSLVEAYQYMKGEPDMMAMYNAKYQEAMQQLNRLGTGLERGDAYRDGQAKIKVNP
jgi:hypothetical protein|tara:strand:- start:1399 stop:2088 length:690 start_codon:yes stop_codon:yes gene_type:complete